MRCSRLSVIFKIFKSRDKRRTLFFAFSFKSKIFKICVHLSSFFRISVVLSFFIYPRFFFLIFIKLTCICCTFEFRDNSSSFSSNIFPINSLKKRMCFNFIKSINAKSFTRIGYEPIYKIYC